MSGGGKATADRTLPQPVIDALAAAFPTTTALRTNFPYAFACPAAVLRDAHRLRLSQSIHPLPKMSTWMMMTIRRKSISRAR